MAQSTNTEFNSAEYVDFIMKRFEVADQSALETFLEVLAIAKLLNCGMDSYFTGLGISHARFKVMINLLYRDKDGGLSPAALADVLNVKRATITGLLDTLENDQWVERHPDPNDRRGLLVKITQAGIAKLDSILPQHYERIVRGMQVLSDEEKDQLKVLIRKFGHGLNAMEGAVADKKLEDSSEA